MNNIVSEYKPSQKVLNQKLGFQNSLNTHLFQSKCNQPEKNIKVSKIKYNSYYESKYSKHDLPRIFSIFL